MDIYVNSFIVDMILCGIILMSVIFSLKRRSLYAIIHTITLLFIFVISTIAAKVVPELILYIVPKDLPKTLDNFIQSTVTTQFVFVIVFGILYGVVFKIISILMQFSTFFPLQRPFLSLILGIVNGFIMALSAVLFFTYINQFHGHNLVLSLDGTLSKFLGSIVQVIFDVPIDTYIDIKEIEQMFLDNL